MAPHSLLIALVLLSISSVEAGPNKVFPAAPGKQRKDKQDCYIVKIKEGKQGRRQELFDKTEGTDGKVLQNANIFYKCNCRKRQILELSDDDDIEYIEEDSEFSAIGQQAVGPYANLDRVDQNTLPLNGQYNYEYTGQGVPIYILDTGVSAAHQEFTGRVLPGIDMIAGGNGNTDCQGHGTHVAGTAAGINSGVAKEATIVPVRVLDCSGSGSTSTIISGIEWATSQPRGVISMSLGGGFSQASNDAIAAATAKNFVVVVAAGNSNADACNTSPASAPSAITVGAVASNDQRSSYSNFGQCVDIFAPGDNVQSASYTSNTGYRTLSGTSMATPMVAGTAALYLHANPSLTAQQVTAMLINAATTGVVTDPRGSPNRLLYTLGIQPVSPVSGSPSPSPVSASPSPRGGLLSGLPGLGGLPLVKILTTTQNNMPAKSMQIHASPDSMYTKGLKDWGYHIGTPDQITSLNAVDLSALAANIDKTKVMQYIEGFHAHIMTQQNANFVLSTLANAAITLAVSDWGSAVTKAVVTSFSINRQTLSQLHLQQDDANPILFACQIDRMDEGGHLLNSEPLALQVKVSQTMPFSVTLHTAEHPEGMDMTLAGGHSIYDATCDCHKVHLPYTAMTVIQAHPMPEQGAITALSQGRFPYIVLGFLAITSIIGGIVGCALYRLRSKAKPAAKLTDTASFEPTEI